MSTVKSRPFNRTVAFSGFLHRRKEGDMETQTQTRGCFLDYVCASNGDKGDIFKVVLGRYILESNWMIIKENITER